MLLLIVNTIVKLRFVFDMVTRMSSFTFNHLGLWDFLASKEENLDLHKYVVVQLLYKVFAVTA